jgi:alpha-methylacyl-CoA racemase
MGPLAGVTVVELAGIGALPFATLKLADMGADVIRVHRAGEVPADPQPGRFSEFDRGRRSIAVDLKHPDGVEVVLRLAERADALVESFRPGVAERLGVGPDAALARNPKLVYGRLTGWGQDGPLASSAAHSLNYESITGAIGSIGPKGGPPVPLLQILGDFAGGGLHLAYGVVCALFEAQRSGQGQVIDAAMVDGVASLFTVFYMMAGSGMHTEDIGTNLFDGGSPFYNVYETSDGKYVTLAPIEPHFYALLLDKLGIDASDLPEQYDQSHWPEVTERIAAVVRTRTRDEWEQELGGTDACFAPVYRTKTRDEWSAIFDGTDACVAPVLSAWEAHEHPHNVARDLFLPTPDGGRQVAPAPRFSRTVAEPGTSYAYPGVDTDAVLGELGFAAAEIASLRDAGAVA